MITISLLRCIALYWTCLAMCDRSIFLADENIFGSDNTYYLRPLESHSPRLLDALKG